MKELLLNTYQIPSEKRVLPIKEEKYPLQQYKPATAPALLAAAMDGEVEAKNVTAEDAAATDAYTFEAFASIMKG